MSTKRMQLTEFDPKEISFVKRPANYKRFLIHKSAGDTVDNKSMKKAILQLPKETLAAIDAVAGKLLVQKDAEDGEAAPLSEGAQAALKAIGRILAPYRDELRDAHMDAVQQAVGIGDAQVHPAATPEGVDEGDPDDSADAADTEGDDDADNAPDAADDDDQDPEPPKPRVAKNPPKPAKAGKPEAGDSTSAKSGDIVAGAMSKTANLPSDAVQNAVDAATKAFSTALKTAINKSADDKPADDKTAESKDDTVGNTDEKEQVNKSSYDALTRELAELKASHKDLVEKSASRDKELAAEREAAIQRDYDERAAKYESVGDRKKIAAILKSAHGDKEAQENLEAILKAAQERSAVTDAYGGNITSELGTRQGAGGGAENEMQALVNRRIEKSADSKMTAEQMFVDTIKNTEEGRKLYAKLTGERV